MRGLFILSILKPIDLLSLAGWLNLQSLRTHHNIPPLRNLEHSIYTRKHSSIMLDLGLLSAV